jgi:hypothetical protein
MKGIFRTLMGTALLLLSLEVRSTICFPPDPQEIYDRHDVAVLAIPKAASVMPRDAPENGFPFPFRQTIIWHVLISWKGPYQSGGTFTTRTNFDEDVGCVQPIHDDGPKLIYVSGRAPYALRDAYNLRLAVEQFQHLEGLRHEP